jgi:hypothetical protein
MLAKCSVERVVDLELMHRRIGTAAVDVSHTSTTVRGYYLAAPTTSQRITDTF